MEDVKNSILITVTTPKVVPFVTEAVPKKKAILKNGKGDFVELSAHQIKKSMIDFLEKSGLSLEYSTTESRRGKAEIVGISVKVSPVKHTHYDGGALIKVDEEDELSFKNTIKILKFLNKNGISVDRECEVSSKGTSCLTKLKEMA